MREKGTASHFRRAALFIALAMLLQLLFTVLLTPQGLVRLYPYAVRANSEKVENDASFSEYFSLRQDFSGCTMFFLGADTTVADTYFVMFDYLRFLKRNFEITSVVMNMGKVTADHINKCILAEDIEELHEVLSELRSSGRFSSELLNFVKNLCTFNKTLTPERKITVKPLVADSLYNATISRMSSDILSNFGSTSPEISAIMSITDINKFFEYMTEHSAAFAEYLGEEKYSRYMEIKSHYEAGDYTEWAIARKLPDLVAEPTLVIVGKDTVGIKSPLRRFVDELGVKGAYVEVKYADCRGIAHNTETEINDIDLPFASQRSVRFVARGDIEGFRAYYRLIANPAASEERREAGEYLDTLATPDFFVVVGSSAVSYDEGKEVP